LPLRLTGECDDACEFVASVVSPPPRTIEARSRQAQVLVVEDGRADRELLVAELSSAGFAVLEASDGDTAIDLATHSHPQVIVLDLILQGPAVCRSPEC
jgi:PleD family two-component response regulator